MTDKQALKEQYKKMKPDMGVYMIRNTTTNCCFMEATNDLKSRMNRMDFQLGAGGHPNKRLQKAWKEDGSGSFEFVILDHLSYSKDESKTDYSEDLAVLESIWYEKLKEERHCTFY